MRNSIRHIKRLPWLFQPCTFSRKFRIWAKLGRNLHTELCECVAMAHVAIRGQKCGHTENHNCLDALISAILLIQGNEDADLEWKSRNNQWHLIYFRASEKAFTGISDTGSGDFQPFHSARKGWNSIPTLCSISLCSHNSKMLKTSPELLSTQGNSQMEWEIRQVLMTRSSFWSYWSKAQRLPLCL